MRSEDFNSEAAIQFAPSATRPTSYRANARDMNNSQKIRTAQAEAELLTEGHEENLTEFAWQGEGDGEPPSRKKMLCFKLRRIFRLRVEQSYRSIEETRDIFLA